MRTVLRAVLVAAALVSAAAVSHADTVRLKTGAILVGDVELAEDGDIVITARFPEEGTFTLKRDQLEPRSLYDVLDRRTAPGDADARLQLGELAESTGLYGIAVSDYLAVAELKPELRGDMERRIERVREAIAEERSCKTPRCSWKRAIRAAPSCTSTRSRSVTERQRPRRRPGS